MPGQLKRRHSPRRGPAKKQHQISGRACQHICSCHALPPIPNDTRDECGEGSLMFEVKSPKTKSEASSRSIITVGCEQTLHDRLKLRAVNFEILVGNRTAWRVRMGWEMWLACMFPRCSKSSVDTAPRAVAAVLVVA